MPPTLGPTLLRLCLDPDDEDAWTMAGELVDGMDLAQARQTAWDTTVFVTRLLVQLRNERPELVDPDALVAEWGLAAYAKAEGIEVTR